MERERSYVLICVPYNYYHVNSDDVLRIRTGYVRE